MCMCLYERCIYCATLYLCMVFIQLRSTIKELQRTHEDMRLQGYELFKVISALSKDKVTSDQWWKVKTCYRPKTHCYYKWINEYMNCSCCPVGRIYVQHWANTLCLSCTSHWIHFASDLTCLLYFFLCHIHAFFTTDKDTREVCSGGSSEITPCRL